MTAKTVTKKQYVNVLFDDNLMKRVDDFRFKNRFPSRTEAIRWLLNWALRQRPVPPEQA
jgi:metal-responsive CopG/Arc/MetJ family transcriptional regulator